MKPTTKATVAAGGTMATVSAGVAALLTLWMPAAAAAAVSSALVALAGVVPLGRYLELSGRPPIPAPPGLTRPSPARQAAVIAAAQPEPTPAPEVSGVVEVRDGQRVANRVHDRPRSHGRFR